jgi:cytochrome P450
MHMYELGRVMTTTDHEASATAVKLPPGPSCPTGPSRCAALADRRIALQILRRRYGRRSRSICTVFPSARRFDPDRFLSRPPDPAEWIPYGGGIRRCIGAAFATMEMRGVLRTLLRNYVISPSSARDVRWQSRGVAVAPSRGARVRIQPRRESATVIG